MKNKALKKWLQLKENKMLADTVESAGIVIDDHAFVRKTTWFIDGFVCKKCKLGIGYDLLEGEDYGAPGVSYSL